MPRTGWWRFTAWVLAGALAFFAFLTGFSIGLFVLPFAVAAVWLVARGGRLWPEILGLVGGIGAIGIVIAALNREGSGCRTTEEGGFTTVTCGGLDPLPWLVAGLLLPAVASLLYGLARRRIEKTP